MRQCYNASMFFSEWINQKYICHSLLSHYQSTHLPNTFTWRFRICFVTKRSRFFVFFLSRKIISKEIFYSIHVTFPDNTAIYHWDNLLFDNFYTKTFSFEDFFFIYLHCNANKNVCLCQNWNFGNRGATFGYKFRLIKE